MSTEAPRKSSLGSTIAGLGSAGLLAGALGFQFIGGLDPCVLCIWQRWPHLVAVLIAALMLKVRSPILALMGCMAAMASSGIGLFHTGVERGWWEGLKACSGGLDVTKLTAEDALNAIMNAHVVKCDEVAWQMAGLSMASWNMLISAVLALIWLAHARKLLKI